MLLKITAVHDGAAYYFLLSALLLDPMNALTNLTGVGGGPGAIGMGPRPVGAPGMGAMGAMQIGQHAMAGVAGNPQASEFVSSMCCTCTCSEHSVNAGPIFTESVRTVPTLFPHVWFICSGPNPLVS